MKSQLIKTSCLGATMALLAGATAIAAGPTVVRAGTLVVAINGGIAPQKLPKAKMAPIKLRMSTNIRTSNGTQPPVAKTVTIDFDKHGTINAKGLASCKRGKLEARTTTEAKRVCRNAIVGTGKTTVQVAFAEQAPFTSSGPLVVFNGGTRGATTTMYIHAYVNVPAAVALVTEVRVKKVRKGRFGTRAVARIPKIAGGAGALTRFNLAIQRTFKYKNKKQSYLLARCGRGRLFANGVLAFDNGTKLTGNIVRPCTPKG